MIRLVLALALTVVLVSDVGACGRRRRGCSHQGHAVAACCPPAAVSCCPSPCGPAALPPAPSPPLMPKPEPPKPPDDRPDRPDRPGLPGRPDRPPGDTPFAVLLLLHNTERQARGLA